MKAGNKLMKLIDYLIMDCISYTVVSLLLSILSSMGIVKNMDYRILLQLLLCTTIISLVMYIVNRIVIDSWWKELVIGLINGSLVVLVMGGALFHWFPWKYQYVAMVIVIFIASYLTAYGIRLAENKMMSDKINHIIKERRK